MKYLWMVLVLIFLSGCWGVEYDLSCDAVYCYNTDREWMNGPEFKVCEWKCTTYEGENIKLMYLKFQVGEDGCWELYDDSEIWYGVCD